MSERACEHLMGRDGFYELMDLYFECHEVDDLTFEDWIVEYFDPETFCD